MLNKIKNWLWALKRRKVRVIVDTCILLNRSDRERLKYLPRVFVPRAVQEQINRMALNREIKNEADARKMQEILKMEELMVDKIANKKWKIVGSAGTGLLQKIENKKLAEFNPELISQFKAVFSKRKDVWNKKRDGLGLSPIIFEPEKLVLRDLLGSTDLRILTACLNLKHQNNKNGRPFYLATRDQTLLILAKILNIDTVQQIKDLP